MLQALGALLLRRRSSGDEPGCTHKNGAASAPFWDILLAVRSAEPRKRISGSSNGHLDLAEQLRKKSTPCGTPKCEVLPEVNLGWGSNLRAWIWKSRQCGAGTPAIYWDFRRELRYFGQRTGYSHDELPGSLTSYLSRKRKVPCFF